jgi:hypothetical protein
MRRRQDQDVPLLGMSREDEVLSLLSVGERLETFEVTKTNRYTHY